MTLESALQQGRQELKSAGIEEYELDAWYLLEHVCKISKNYYYLHSKGEIGPEELHEYEILLRKRIERIPLQYLTGVQEFMGIPFKVNCHVLIPRQDTETLVETALEIIKPGMSVLDLCTGSGSIIICLAKFVAGIKACGSDISKQALLVAKENAKMNDVEVDWVCSNLFRSITGTYDMIVANPPYIPSGEIGKLMSEVHFEPVQALDGKEDGLFFYKDIIENAGPFLSSGGFLLFEIGYDQGGEVSEMMKQAGFLQVQVINDLGGLNRVVLGRKNDV